MPTRIEVNVQTGEQKTIELSAEELAQAGFVYNETYQTYVPPQPYPSWTLNSEIFQWQAPVPYPANGMYTWDEATLSWVAT
jgi:hypothetical protein